MPLLPHDAAAADANDDDHHDVAQNDRENDADTDDACGDLDSCPYDPENDADGDGYCLPVCGYSSCTDQRLCVQTRVRVRVHQRCE